MENNNQELKPLFRKVGEVKPVTEQSTKVTPASKREYLILYYATIDKGEEEKSFEIVTGREAAYEFIKTMVECIDIHKSKVLVDTVSYNKAATVYEFMKYIGDKNFFNDTFDIEDYNIGDM